MSDVLLPAGPRTPLQVAPPEGVVEQLPLVEPGGMRRREPGTPPASALGEVLGCLPGDVAGSAVVDEEDPPEPAMLPPEPFQFRGVVIGVVGPQADGLHLARMDNQERQEIDRAVPGVLELPLLDRAGNRATNRPAFEHLAVAPEHL